jgi:hypothetical protein
MVCDELYLRLMLFEGFLVERFSMGCIGQSIGVVLMPDSLQFMDCPHCAKRVRTNAQRCHHCGKSPQNIDHSSRTEGPESVREVRSAFGRRKTRRGPSRDHSIDSQEHHASDRGGYDTRADDFDYEAFLEAEFGRGNRAVERPWWWYVAWLVLAVLVVSLVMDALQLLPR